MTVARSALLIVLACVCSLALAGGALAQTSVPEPEPQAIEPQVGTTAPVQPGATTVPVAPVPVPTVTVTGGGAPATTGGAPATAGGVVITKTETQDSGGVSWEAVALIALGALLLFVLIVLLLWRVRGWDPRWLQRWRHAMAEAGWRLSLGWAEFRDFVRLGR